MKPHILQLPTALAAALMAAVFAGCGSGNQGAGGRTDGASGMMHGGSNGMPMSPATTTATTAEGTAAGSGRALFVAYCGGCHTLAAADTTSPVGPDLDRAGASYNRVLELVTKGRGEMPAFAGSLTRRQIEAISRYVTDATR